MEELIIDKIKKISQMKSPVILMSKEDFEEMKKTLESKVAGVDFNNVKDFKFMNIPIKTSFLINKGDIIIYDQEAYQVELIFQDKLKERINEICDILMNIIYESKIK